MEETLHEGADFLFFFWQDSRGDFCEVDFCAKNCQQLRDLNADRPSANNIHALWWASDVEHGARGEVGDIFESRDRRCDPMRAGSDEKM